MFINPMSVCSELTTGDKSLIKEVSSCIILENMVIAGQENKQKCDCTSTSGSALGAVCSIKVMAVPLIRTREDLPLAVPN